MNLVFSHIFEQDFADVVSQVEGWRPKLRGEIAHLTAQEPKATISNSRRLGIVKPMTDPGKIFELPISIQPADIDELGHVNNVIYLRWVQEAATAHWRADATAADQAALRWVVVRHEIDYKRAAFLRDSIIARTWVGTASRHRFERHTELVRAADRRLLASARTVWCPIDAATGRPTDVSAEVMARFSTPDDGTAGSGKAGGQSG